MAHEERNTAAGAKPSPANIPQEHLVRCEECGSTFDVRDLREFTRHMHPSHKRARAKAKPHA
jgi:hypothetical protein